LLSLVVHSSLTGCAIGGAELGSLAAAGLQALAGDSPHGPTNTGPFRTVDNSQTIQQLDDLASRTVSRTCVADTERSTTSEEQAAASDPTSAGDDDARCAYRNICLPGNMRPVRMLVCRSDPAPPAIAHAEAQQSERRQ
jgi:hypothetical protein